MQENTFRVPTEEPEPTLLDILRLLSDFLQLFLY